MYTHLLQVAESFDRFFEDPGLVVMATNVLFTVNPMFYFLTRAIMGLLFPKCASAIFAYISHPISSCEILEIQWSQHDYCPLKNLPPCVPGVNLIKLLQV